MHADGDCARALCLAEVRDGFFKEVPTYQADLNEALLVSSGALMYQADRTQAFYTTGSTLAPSVHAFEQGSYSNKYYTPTEHIGPGALNDSSEAYKNVN